MNRSPDDARRLLAAYDDCMAVDGAAREARIARHEREDPGIATRLRSMLAVDAGPAVTDAFGIESVVGELVAAATGAAAEGSRQAGPFTLLRLLGRGGMGEVWLAERDHDGFRQQVALKRLRSGRDSEDLRRRFVQERRILAELSHPGIARFIDGGIDDAGAPWYAMEYVQGVPITEHAAARGLDARARVALLAEVAEAVAYAQNHLVVHRDLKPSNILIDAEGRPRLLDFGIAKLLDAAAAGEGETAAGLRAMTPDYAAPEQILGAPVSAATDVYALGVVLYQLLTGDLPHTRGAASLESLVDAVRTEVPERPSARLRRVGAGGSGTGGAASRTLRTLRGDLDTIALMALRREPERRYASAADFARDLRRWLDGRPIAAQADTTGYRMRKFVARHRLAVGSASAVLLALIAGFGTALWQASVARSEAARAQQQAEVARKAQADAEAINQFFGRMLVDARAQDQGAGAALTVKDWVLAAVPRLDEALKDAPAARATLRRELGAALHQLGASARAREVLETAVAENAAAYGDSLQTAVATTLLGSALYAVGEPAESRRRAEAAIVMLDGLPSTNDVRLDRIQARTTLLRIHSLGGDHAMALTLAERNLEERAALFGADDPRLAVDYNNLASSYNRLGRLAEAETAQRKSLALLERNPERPVARIAFVHTNLCMLAVQRARYADAEASCQAARARYTESLGPDSIEIASVDSSRAHVAFAAGDSDAARALLDDAEPRLVAAQRKVDVLLVATVRMRLAVRDADWKRVEAEGERLRSMLPPPTADAVADERLLADAFTSLARGMRSGHDGAVTEARRIAASMLERPQVVAYYRATAALAGSLAAAAEGDRSAAQGFREAAVAALAENMPREEAVALWARWLPVEQAPR